ncbi:MAG: iron-containing alcohol dehydrogenase, partial [Coprobacillaceae bacterium]
YCPIVLKEPDNYEARANLMWASSMALNGLTGSGKNGSWSCHPIEHELSAFYDITHGVGLAILTPQWMRYILSDKTVDKFVEYATNVWHLTGEDKFALANKAIDATEQFFKDCGLPMTLKEVGVPEDKFDIMANNAAINGDLINAYVPLTKEDVKRILEMSK